MSGFEKVAQAFRTASRELEEWPEFIVNIEFFYCEQCDTEGISDYYDYCPFCGNEELYPEKEIK